MTKTNSKNFSLSLLTRTVSRKTAEELYVHCLALLTGSTELSFVMDGECPLACPPQMLQISLGDVDPE